MNPFHVHFMFIFIQFSFSIIISHFLFKRIRFEAPLPSTWLKFHFDLHTINFIIQNRMSLDIVNEDADQKKNENGREWEKIKISKGKSEKKMAKQKSLKLC